MNRNWLLLVPLILAVPNVVADDEDAETKERVKKRIVSLGTGGDHWAAGNREEKEAQGVAIEDDVLTVKRKTYTKGKNRKGTRLALVSSDRSTVALKKLDPDKVTITQRSVARGKVLTKVWTVSVSTLEGKKVVRVKDKEGRTSTTAVVFFRVKDQQTATRLKNALVRYIKLCGEKGK